MKRCDLSLRHLDGPCRTFRSTRPGRIGILGKSGASHRAVRHAEAVNSAVSTGCFQLGRHERHRRQVVDFLGAGLFKDLGQRRLIEQIRLVQGNAVAEMLDALEVFGAGPADDAADLVTLVEQELREIAAVLTGDACDESSFCAMQAPSGKLSFVRSRGARSHGAAALPWPYSKRQLEGSRFHLWGGDCAVTAPEAAISLQ